MKFLVFIFLLGIGALFFSNRTKSIQVFDSEITPNQNVKNHFLAILSETIDETKQLKKLIQSRSENELIQKDFIELKGKMKSIEFLLAHLDPQAFLQFVNGAPLPKVEKKVPDFNILEPKGFQRIEELLFEENIEWTEAEELISKLENSFQQYHSRWIKMRIENADIFEACRYGLLRVLNLGVTGFDAPMESEKTLQESINSMKSIQRVLNLYQIYVPDYSLDKMNLAFEKGNELLEKSNFDEFNRAEFLKISIQPLWEETLKFQNALKVELPKYRNQPISPINYEETSLLSPDFFNLDYFGSHQGERQKEKIALGKILFFDPVLSKGNDRACASCHRPEKGFTDGLKTSLETATMKPSLRNSPTVLNSTFATNYFYDLRADRLSMQMDHVVLNPVEFDSDYQEIVKKLMQSEEYLALFEKAFGSKKISREEVTNAVTSYVSSLNSFNSPFDKYIRGEANVDKDVIAGYNLFAGKASCATCHFLPTFSGLIPPYFDDSESEVLGVPKENKKPFVLDDDIGRIGNGKIKERAEFYRFSFKTPTIRNIALTAPYMHNGSFETLEDVVEFYNNGGGAGVGLDVPFQTLPADSLKLNKKEQKQLVKFMEALTDTVGFTSYPSSLPSFPSEMRLDDRVIGGEY